MSSARPGKEEELLHLVEHAARHEGLTFGVLQEILQQLRNSESSIHHFVLLGLSREYRQQSFSELDGITARFGGLQPQTVHQRELQKLATHHSQVQQRLQEVSEKAHSLETAANVQGLLDTIDQHAHQGRFGPAASCIAHGLDILARAEGENEAESLLHTQLKERKARLVQILFSKIQQGISIQASKEQQTILVKRGGLADAWSGLVALNEASEALLWMSSQLHASIFGPLVTSQQPLTLSDGPEGYEEESIEALQISYQAPPPTRSREAGIVHCLDYIQDVVLQENAEAYQMLGRTLWGQVASDFIDHCLQGQLPHSKAEFLEFERLAISARDMEKCLLERGFLTAEGSIDELPIHRYTQQHMSAWLHEMRQRLVVEARPFLLKPDYDTVTVGIPLPFPSGSDGIPGSHSPNLGADSEAASASEDGCRLGWGQEGEEAPLLASGRYQVSKGCQRLLSLLKGYLVTACKSDNGSISLSTLMALKDIAAMAAAIPPVLHQRDFQVPLIAALYHNDCQHLAEELLLLPHCFPALQQKLGISLNLQDTAQQLRQAGSRCLDNLAMQQQKELKEVLEAAGGFKQVSKAQAGIKARKVIQQTLHLLGLVGKALQPVLTPHSFVQLGAQLLDCAASEITGSILAIRDISIEESEDLPRILQPFVDDAASRFCDNQTTSQGMAADELATAMKVSSTHLQRLQAVIHILVVKLSDIWEEWKSGTLQGQGLTAREVHHLVTALFEDTDLRLDVLRELSA